jgi:hypothetical protein
MEAHDFTAEQMAFEAKKPELLSVCPGKFAVFHGEAFLGTYDNYQAAYAAGLQKWGNVSFFIKPVLTQDPIESMPALCLGLVHASL